MRAVWWPLCLKGPDPDPCHTHIHIPTHSTPAPQHIPSHPITNQHTATPTIHFKTNFGDRFLRKKIPPVGCSVDTQPPSPFLVKVDEGICKCPSRAKKGTTQACLFRACHYSTLTHLGDGVAWNQRIWTIGGIFFRKNWKGKSVPFSRPRFVLICFHNLAPRHVKLCLPRSDHCINHGTNSSALDRRRVGLV